MESSHINSGPPSAPSSRSRSSTLKIGEDITSLTSFNPFSEEDENEQSSYALVTSLFSKVKNTLSAPLTSSTTTTSAPPATINHPGPSTEQRRPSFHANGSNKSLLDRQRLLNVNTSNAAPPVISLTPVVSEPPSYTDERPPSRNASYFADTPDGLPYGTAIPGFPIPDSDSRSIKTTVSIRRSASASKAIRRIRGEGLSRDYWMDDELCKECYDCKSVFTTWRRKHHCRICGQIFCSRCASNIIKGARFGQDGMIRICNLCLEKLAKVDDEDDDDDRRSINSNMTSPFAAHQMGTEPFSFSLGHHPQSPFAASRLFGRTDEPFNLFSIAETQRPRLYSGSDDSDVPSRPFTPPGSEDRGERYIRENPVPFRRTLAEEEKDPVSLSNDLSRVETPTGAGSKTPVDFPIIVPVSVDASMSSVQFPVSSPDQANGGDRDISRSRFDSSADADATTPFIRSRVHSRLDSFATMNFGAGEAGWRTRRESTAYAQELNLISMFHLRIMLRQMLKSEDIPNVKEWEETLLTLALRIARELTFTAHPHRQGADMDVRRYVKIKKIPGGVPKDSEYVDGAVITKNVAHKQMSRSLHSPRIMLVTFPLEFHRVEGQYMHFRQLMLQETEYLNNLASRIAALRPHVLLAEKTVSRLALDALTKHNIAVARTVKPSAIQFVARMTQGDVLSSIDRLALEPRLGHCGSFRIQTFDHPLIPGRRKTYMRFEGCNGEMGCTILLRGGDIETLRRIKKVTRFLAFIVRNLRLETHLWKDSVITLPNLTAQATPAGPLPAMTPTSSTDYMGGSSYMASANERPAWLHDRTAEGSSSVDDNVEDLPNEDAEQIRLSRRIQESLLPYETTFISVSATLRFPPPYPIRRMKELDDELMQVKREWEDEVVRREEKLHSAHQQEETITADIAPVPDPDDVAAQIESLRLPPLDPTSSPEETETSSDDGPQESRGYLASSSDLSTFGGATNGVTASPASMSIVEETPVQIKTVEDIALESRYVDVKWQHAEQRRIWEWYLRKNKDDFDVEKYQCITLWEFTLPMAEFGLHRACSPPQLKYITFYGENDCTLGQFIERAVTDTLVQFLDPKAICENKSCGRPLARHCKVYVHNESRLFVAVEQWDGQIIGRTNYAPSPDSIITWSACRVCGSATPFIPVSEEMQRYSFGKFLELHFYPADVQLVQGAGCHHNIYQHHIRFFAIRGMTVRFQADPIVLNEIVYPPMRIRLRPETQLEIKNTDFERLHQRNNTWYSALIDDLQLITIDAATGDEEADARLNAEINKLIVKAEWEKNDIAKLINQIYKDTPPTDTLALNQVRAYRQDKIVAWQQDFDKLPRPRVPALLDRNSRKSSAFGSVRAMWPRKSELYGQLAEPPGATSEADDGIITMRRVTGGSVASTSSASDASDSESIPDKRKTRKPAVHVDVKSSSSPVLVPALPKIVQNLAKSDPDSDSTIGAGRPLGNDAPPESSASRPQTEVEETTNAIGNTTRPISRLPRRPSIQPSVAELVKKYQDFLPAQGVEELAKTAFAPAPIEPESEPESLPDVRVRARNKGRHQFMHRKSSASDFEQSYAANIAPKYLTHSRRPLGTAPYSSRIPAPALPSLDSRDTSRRTSPDKRMSLRRSMTDTVVRAGGMSPPQHKPSLVINYGKTIRKKASTRNLPKDKAPLSRPTSSAGLKATIKRNSGPGSKVSNIAKHFERINKDNERANRRYAVIRGKRARPVASARAKVEILESIKDAIKDETESSDSSDADDEGDDDDNSGKLPESKSPKAGPSEDKNQQDGQLSTAGSSAEPLNESPTDIHESAEVDLSHPVVELPPLPPSVPDSPMLGAMAQQQNVSATPPIELEAGATGTERHSILKALSGLWPQQAPQPRNRDAEGDDPMSDPEHIFRESSMVVRTDEPTSIIALALNSPQYRDMLAKSRAEKRQAKEAKLTEGGEVFMPDDKSVADSLSTWGVVNVDSTESGDPTEELRVPSSKLPWAISFESGGLTISCTVLYPEQFDALRRTYDCERSLIESLARCVKWDASGGKSGSAFLKTLDDRFIAKELSRAELQSMETFAPAYFDYMSSAVVAGRPTLLAKIFGCYKITFKKTQENKGSSKSKPTQMNLLVMENLFYDRRFSKIYDLKGSTRGRHVQSTGRENEVLLDENLVQTAHLAPFYLREHSKRILRGALFNDSKFLADINVMDYSLVVGVDSVKNELVVGIVDFIRTYTWDKKLESWVKDSTFLGGANKGEPTIIGPRQYRQRFLSAMERYFPLVPDRWMKQHDAPEEEGNNLLELWPDW